MLERRVHPNGVVTFQSPLLRGAGVVHAFSTRLGGISGGAYASLNLGNPSEGEPDAIANIHENFRRLQEAIGAGHMRRASVLQVHGGSVETIAPEPAGEYAETLAAELRDRFTGQTAADGLVSAAPHILLTIRTADCVPVLLATPGGAVAALHAGWRGIVGGIVESGLGALGAAEGDSVRQGNENGVMAAIGPGISGANFEVGEEVAGVFERSGFGSAVQHFGGRKPHVDLQAVIAEILRRNGVKHIDGNDLCTFRDAAEFYSHRREAGRTGRMVAVIAARYNRPHETP